MVDSKLLDGRVTSDWSLYPFDSPSPEPRSVQTSANEPFFPQNARVFMLPFSAGKAHVKGNRGDDAVCGEPEEDI